MYILADHKSANVPYTIADLQNNTTLRVPNFRLPRARLSLNSIDKTSCQTYTDQCYCNQISAFPAILRERAPIRMEDLPSNDPLAHLI